MQLYLGSARKQHRSTLKGSKQKHEVLRFSSRRETPRFHVLNFRAMSGHNLLYMRSDVSKEMSRFRLPSSGRRRPLLKVPINYLITESEVVSDGTLTERQQNRTERMENGYRMDTEWMENRNRDVCRTATEHILAPTLHVNRPKQGSHYEVAKLYCYTSQLKYIGGEHVTCCGSKLLNSLGETKLTNSPEKQHELLTCS